MNVSGYLDFCMILVIFCRWLLQQGIHLRTHHLLLNARRLTSHWNRTFWCMYLCSLHNFGLSLHSAVESYHFEQQLYFKLYRIVNELWIFFLKNHRVFWVPLVFRLLIRNFRITIRIELTFSCLKSLMNSSTVVSVVCKC